MKQNISNGQDEPTTGGDRQLCVFLGRSTRAEVEALIATERQSPECWRLVLFLERAQVGDEEPRVIGGSLVRACGDIDAIAQSFRRGCHPGRGNDAFVTALSVNPLGEWTYRFLSFEQISEGHRAGFREPLLLE